jgi:hypothetical protein
MGSGQACHSKGGRTTFSKLKVVFCLNYPVSLFQKLSKTAHRELGETVSISAEQSFNPWSYISRKP